MLDIEFVERTDVDESATIMKIIFGYAFLRRLRQMRSHGWLFALADGVGGHEMGEVASRLLSKACSPDSRARRAENHTPHCCPAWCRKPTQMF